MRNRNRVRFHGLLIIWCVFLVIAFVLYHERSGIAYKQMERAGVYLPRELSMTGESAAESLETECLFVMDSRDADSCRAKEEFSQILKDMKIGYQVVDLAGMELPALEDYRTAVVALCDLSALGEGVIRLTDWVYEGGRVLFPLTIRKEGYSGMIEQKLGIIESSYKNAMVEQIWPEKGFMLGGGIPYAITDPYESAWSVQLGETAKVHAWTGDGRGVPLVWEKNYGKGRFVVDNFGLYVKAVRGFYAASYSLLEDVCAYPVLNGAVFYLDDFPSPVPMGDGSYITRDYHTTISDFYTNIWWPDMLDMAERHGVRYTGAVIENYEDMTDGTITEQKDVSRFQHFGNMLLRSGGEIGYHGYNHQPLALENTDYGDVLPYETWSSTEAMKKGLEELIHFEEDLYPAADKTVYVPPSNVLTKEGRDLLVKEFPHIRTIASNYFSGDCVYTQEFSVSEDGIVEQPRIISGAVLDNYMKLSAVSELNMHMVSSHFIHPDDLLDEDRGAALGWEELKRRLDQYMTWLFDSAPGIRRLTGSELSGSIQRFCAVSPKRQLEEDRYTLTLENFHDEAWFFVRFHEKDPGRVTGGELSLLEGDLYLLKAREPVVTIELEERT